jgi:hypothetical protein
MSDPFVELAFRPPPTLDRIGRLVDLWRRGRTIAENMPACPCHGVVPGVIDPDVMEHNMLAPLRARYRQDGRDELVALIDRRMRKSPFAGARAAFPDWLHTLGEAALDATARKELYADLEAALAFYAESTAPFTCA